VSTPEFSQAEAATRVGLIHVSGCEEPVPQATEDSIQLVQIDVANLRRLAGSEPVDLGDLHVLEGALPPRKPVARALAQLELGTPPLWCVPFLIICPSRGSLLGACGFKFAPADGSVEISYGIAKAERGRGVATAAVGKLLQMAASSGQVQQVVAHILPDNVASSRLASRLGFSAGPLVVDGDGEQVVRWVWRVAS